MYVEKESERDAVLEVIWLNPSEKDEIVQYVDS